MDEWGTWYDVEPGTNPGFLYQQSTLRDAQVAALTLNIFNRHASRVVMANLAQTVNVLQAVILTEGDKMVLTPKMCIRDSSISCSRVLMSQIRQGAMIFICGSKALMVSSKRTWSLPLPVQPWQMAVQFSLWAISTSR